jgi:hypothetical protein
MDKGSFQRALTLSACFHALIAGVYSDTDDSTTLVRRKRVGSHSVDITLPGSAIGLADYINMIPITGVFFSEPGCLVVRLADA